MPSSTDRPDGGNWPPDIHRRARCGLRLALWCAGLIATSPSLRAPSGDDSAPAGFSIAVSSPMVTLSAAVRDSRGRPVEGLSRDNFRLYDEGRPQPLRFFTNEDRPATVGLVVDTSRCMSPIWDKIRNAALAFIETSHPEDEFFLIFFDERPSFALPEGQPFTTRKYLLQSALARSLPPEGRTALYDAILLALRHIQKGRWDKKALLLISDGADNASRSSQADALRAIAASPVTLYAIGYADKFDEDQNPGVLRKLTEPSGGQANWSPSPGRLAEYCRHMSEEFRQRYLLGYDPPGGEPGTFRSIRLEVSAAGRALTVRTRPGYAVPYPPPRLVD